MTAPMKATSITGLPDGTTIRPKSGGSVGWWVDGQTLYVATNPHNPEVTTYNLGEGKLIQYGRTYRYGKTVMSGCQTCGGNPWKRYDRDTLANLTKADA